MRNSENTAEAIHTLPDCLSVSRRNCPMRHRIPKCLP